MRRQVIAGIVATTSVVGLALAPSPPLTSAADKVVFTVGLRQAIDNFNVTVGVTVSDYETWNLHYPTLTGKAAADFAVTPGLATEWSSSADGLTWTYKIRPGMTWSDGEPLTADDVAYTVNRSREEEWANHSSTTQNLTAEATDDTTLVITSAVPDPKLPVMDVYIVPPQVYQNVSADELAAHDATTDPGAGPFILKEIKPGQFWRLEANDNYYGGRPAIDEVIFTLFTDDDAMVAALESGDVDALGAVPSGQFARLQKDPELFVTAGSQGGFTELGLNAGMALDNGHPALKDLNVRKAIAYAVDRQTLIEKTLSGNGLLATTIVPSPDERFQLSLDKLEPFDLAKANSMLDDAGYLDTDNDGVRQMPDGSNPLEFRYFARTESDFGAPVSEFITGWMKEIGISVTVKLVSDSELTPIIGSGEYEMFVWGWTPFVDPDPLLSYFTCDQLAQDPADPSNYYNDASWCDPAYDDLYVQQNQELDPAKRLTMVQQMLNLFHDGGAYVVLFRDTDLNAIRIDRWTGIPCQPTATGPFLLNNTSPIYTSLTPRPEGAAVDIACGDRRPADDGAASGNGSTPGTGGTDATGNGGNASNGGNDSSDGSVLPVVLITLGVLSLLTGIVVALRRRDSSDDRD